MSENSMDEVRQRLTALEAEVDRLREESAQTRALAAMADRDTAEMRTALRAHTQVLNALRETQLEQGQAIQGLAQAVGVLVAGQSEHSRVLESVVAGQTAILEELRRRNQS
ncbi:hypothetical protein [Kitasatospora sp. NPDC001527]|uniref:hypothetical protein n=1 Tax=Kitasatospora sp. NPDC001527 TaxID=3154519 RepID=UPI003325F8F0